MEASIPPKGGKLIEGGDGGDEPIDDEGGDLGDGRSEVDAPLAS